MWKEASPEIELVLEVPPGSPLSLNEHHDAEAGGATGKWWKRWNGKVETNNLSPSASAKRSARWSDQSHWDLTRAAMPARKEGLSILQLVAKKELLWGKGQYPKNKPTVSNFLPDCLPVWGPQTRIWICEPRGIATALGPNRRFLRALRAGLMSKSGGRPCWSELHRMIWKKINAS